MIAHPITGSIALPQACRLRAGGARLVAARSICLPRLHNANLGHLATPPDLRNMNNMGKRSLAMLVAILTAKTIATHVNEKWDDLRSGGVALGAGAEEASVDLSL